MSSDQFDRYPDELRTALTIRLTEERLLRLFSEGKLFGTVHTCIGQELVGVAVARGLRDGDTLFSNHRGHGHFLSYRRNLPGLIGEVMGRAIGVCGGRGGSQHVHQDGFYSNGIQGGIAPVSAGLAFAHKIRGDRSIQVVYLGDGTLGEGALYESMNIASKWELPVLFICENNLYAQSTNQEQTLAGSITARAEAFGIETAHSDTWNFPALFDSMEACIGTMRETGRPFFHRVDTYRLMAHSKGDDNRPDEDVQPYRDRDPLNVVLEARKDDAEFQTMLGAIEAEIEEAVAAADASPYAEIPSTAVAPEVDHQWEPRPLERVRVVESVRRGLEEAMTERSDILVIGEDIESPYGGAFKCTMGLSAKFPDRVRNTPISEAAIVGIGNGLALAGMIPVVEIMFGDFLGLAADQWINHAGKFRFMYNDQVHVPLIVRTPMGGKRGYAATHSQSLEKHFLGVPGTQVLCLHHRYDPARLYRDLFATIDRPTLVIENKILYGTHIEPASPPGFQLLFTNETFPTARLQPQDTPDLTLVALGGMSMEAE